MSLQFYNERLAHPIPEGMPIEKVLGYHDSIYIEGDDEYVIKIAKSMKQGDQTLYDYFMAKDKAAVLGGKFKGMYIILSRKPVETDAWRMLVLDGRNKQNFDDTMAIIRMSLNFRK